MTNDQQVTKLYNWAFIDNGIRSADKRIVENTERLESAFNGERRCQALKSIDKHLETSDTAPSDWVIKKFEYVKEENCGYFNTPALNKRVPWARGITTAMWDFSIGTIPQIAQFLNSRKYHATRKWNTLQRGLSFEELEYFV